MQCSTVLNHVLLTNVVLYLSELLGDPPFDFNIVENLPFRGYHTRSRSADDTGFCQEQATKKTKNSSVENCFCFGKQKQTKQVARRGEGMRGKEDAPCQRPTLARKRNRHRKQRTGFRVLRHLPPRRKQRNNAIAHTCTHMHMRAHTTGIATGIAALTPGSHRSHNSPL